MMRDQIKTGAILSYLLLFINGVIGFIYTPIMLKNLGQSEYGIYALVIAIISYLSILDFGFGNAIIVFASKFKAKKDQKSQEKLYGTFLVVYIIIGFLTLIIGSLIYFNFNLFFINTMATYEISKAKILFMILIFNLAVSFPMSIFGYIIVSYEKFIFTKLLAIMKSILTPCIVIPILFLGYDSVMVVIVTSVINILALLFSCFYYYKKIKVSVSIKFFEYKLFKSVFVYSFFIFLAIVIDRINWSVDQILIGSLIGTAAVSVYSIALQLNIVYLSFSTAIGGILLPKISGMVEDKVNDNKISDIFIKMGRLQFILLALIISGFVLFGKEFIMFWVGEKYVMSYYAACILMIPVTFPLTQSVGISILQAKNMHYFRTITYLIMAIFNIIISIPLIMKFGIIGASIGTAISLVFCNIFIINIYYYKKVNIDILGFWKEIFKLGIPMIIPVLALITIKSFLQITSVFILVVEIFMFCFIYAITIWNFGMNRYEKYLVKTLLKIQNKKIIRK